ncbi:MAG: methyltransferase domain-containing protein [Okeania sp. SIO3B3]|nr:methyltransferase domain-containing protein [Okeania sp. SIO3B3]
MTDDMSNPKVAGSGPEGDTEQRKVLESDTQSVTVEVHGQKFQGRAVSDSFVHESYEDWKKLQCLKGLPDWFERNWEITKDKQIRQWQFADIKPGESALEVGFRDGFNLAYLDSKGVRVVGIEVNPDSVTHALSLGQEAYEEDIQQKTHFDDGQFDVVSACDVLEHCYDPASALNEMYRIMKSDARLVVEIPFETEFSENISHGHSFLFHNVENAKDIFDQCRFRVVKMDLEIPQRNIFLLMKK